MKFDFNEANILKQNLFMKDDTKEILIHRLNNLLGTTEDVILKDSIFSLIRKVETMTPQQIKTLYSDVASKRFIATANFDYGKSDE